MKYNIRCYQFVKLFHLFFSNHFVFDLLETKFQENEVDKFNNKAKPEEPIFGDIFLEKYKVYGYSVDVLVVSHSKQEKVG